LWKCNLEFFRVKTPVTIIEKSYRSVGGHVNFDVCRYKITYFTYFAWSSFYFFNIICIYICTYLMIFRLISVWRFSCVLCAFRAHYIMCKRGGSGSRSNYACGSIIIRKGREQTSRRKKKITKLKNFN